MAIILGVTNQKGGVGKTTSAINIAACLSAANRKTLLIDIDPQANATSGVGIDKNNEHLSSYDTLLDKEKVSEAIIQTEFPNLFVLPSNLKLIGAEIELIDLPFREHRLKLVINMVKDNFDYIVIDAPPSLGLLTLNCLVAAQYLIIPVQAEYFALEGLSVLLQTINRITSNLNPNLTIGGILITMFDSRTNLSQQVFEDLKNHFDELMFHTTIGRSVRFGEAPSFGKPIIYYDFKSPGAVAYIELTGEIIDRFEGDKK